MTAGPPLGRREGEAIECASISPSWRSLLLRAMSTDAERRHSSSSTLHEGPGSAQKAWVSLRSSIATD